MKVGKEVLPSHFDKTWNLKFMLYLDDIKKKVRALLERIKNNPFGANTI